MITKFEEYTLNESLNFNKIKDFIASKFDSLSEDQKEELKTELTPYKGLTREEISEKIKKRIDRSDIDPYGEEDWDPEVDRRNFLKKRIKFCLTKIFFYGIITSLFLWPLILLFSIVGGLFIDRDIDKIVLNISTINSIVQFSSVALFVLCKKLWDI